MGGYRSNIKVMDTYIDGYADAEEGYDPQYPYSDEYMEGYRDAYDTKMKEVRKRKHVDEQG